MNDRSEKQPNVPVREIARFALMIAVAVIGSMLGSAFYWIDKMGEIREELEHLQDHIKNKDTHPPRYYKQLMDDQVQELRKEDEDHIKYWHNSGKP